jgi:uncharacterized protein (TIGR02145 family)
MKRILWSLRLIIILVLLLVISDCKKDHNSVNIDKYIGNWILKEYFHYKTFDYEAYDTVYYYGIIVRGTYCDLLIKFDEPEQDQFYVNIEPNGRIKGPPYCDTGPFCDYIGGAFENDEKFHIISILINDDNGSWFKKDFYGVNQSGKKANGQVPTATINYATGVTSAGATLRGTISSNYLPATVLFEYGISSIYGDTISCTPNILSGDSIMVISYISGLTPGIQYHFRVKAVNSLGTTYSSDMTFTTSSLSDPVSDIDGNIYKTVPIGTQIWMAENLRVTKYNDGTAIPLITDNIAWRNLTTPGYCSYDNNSIDYQYTYGILYNWFTVNTGKLCPKGWHIPNDLEWSTLQSYLDPNAGGKLKESGTTHWINSNEEANNGSGFTALPGGHRYYYLSGLFDEIGYVGKWWSSTEKSLNEASFRLLSNSSSRIYKWDSSYFTIDHNTNKGNGYSVRCLKDN